MTSLRGDQPVTIQLELVVQRSPSGIFLDRHAIASMKLATRPFRPISAHHRQLILAGAVDGIAMTASQVAGCQNVQVAKDFFAAMGSGDKQALLALVAEDIEWIIPGEDWPLAGTHRGHAGLAVTLQKASQKR